MNNEQIRRKSRRSDPFPDGGVRNNERFFADGTANVRDGVSPSLWKPIEVLPRTDVKGKHFGSEHPKFRAILEWNRISGEYRTRPLTDVIENE